MGSLFISYRREDASGHAGRLFDHLARRFGRKRVFMDVSGSIVPGVDFVQAIESAVGSCEALLVVIGQEWLGATDSRGKRRLDDPEDFVRLEIAAALERNVRVIPVLVEGAEMPSSESLPDDLVALVRRQAIELSDARWTFDTTRLAESLAPLLEKDGPAPPSRRWPLVAAALVVAAGLLGWLAWRLGAFDRPPEKELVNKEAQQAQAEQGGGGSDSGTDSGTDSGRDPGRDPGRDSGTTDERTTRPETAVNEVTVPALADLELEVARRTLSEAGLRVGEIHKIASSEAVGTVLRQHPPANDEVARLVAVELWVSTGERRDPPPTRAIELADLSGSPQRKVSDELERLGLKVGRVELYTWGQFDAGVVLSQSPPAASRVVTGSAVDLVVEMRRPDSVRSAGVFYLKPKQGIDVDAGGYRESVRLARAYEARGREPPPSDSIPARVPAEKADFVFGASQTSGYVYPANGAQLAAIERADLNLAGCRSARYATGRLMLDARESSHYYCLKTGRGRHAGTYVRDKVGEPPGELVVGFVTWE